MHSAQHTHRNTTCRAFNHSFFSIIHTVSKYYLSSWMIGEATFSQKKVNFALSLYIWRDVCTISSLFFFVTVEIFQCKRQSIKIVHLFLFIKNFFFQQNVELNPSILYRNFQLVASFAITFNFFLQKKIIKNSHSN